MTLMANCVDLASNMVEINSVTSSPNNTSLLGVIAIE